MFAIVPFLDFYFLREIQWLFCKYITIKLQIKCSKSFFVVLSISCFSSYTITELNSRWQQIHGSRLFLGNGQRECSVTGRVLVDWRCLWIKIRCGKGLRSRPSACTYKEEIKRVEVCAAGWRWGPQIQSKSIIKPTSSPRTGLPHLVSRFFTPCNASAMYFTEGPKHFCDIKKKKPQEETGECLSPDMST